MLVIYRTNKDFEGDIVTIMDEELALAQAMRTPDVAAMSVDLPTADMADLVLNPAAYVVRDVGGQPALFRRDV